MSFDLVVWDADRPPDVAGAKSTYERLRSGQGSVGGPSERVRAFVEEVDRRWADGGRGAARPFTDRRSPSAFLASISQDVATTFFGEWVEMAERHGLVLYDPQSGIIKIPSRLSFEAEPPPLSLAARPSLRHLLRRRRV